MRWQIHHLIQDLSNGHSQMVWPSLRDDGEMTLSGGRRQRMAIELQKGPMGGTTMPRFTQTEIIHRHLHVWAYANNILATKGRMNFEVRRVCVHDNDNILDFFWTTANFLVECRTFVVRHAVPTLKPIPFTSNCNSAMMSSTLNPSRHIPVVI